MSVFRLHRPQLAINSTPVRVLYIAVDSQKKEMTVFWKKTQTTTSTTTAAAAPDGNTLVFFFPLNPTFSAI